MDELLQVVSRVVVAVGVGGELLKVERVVEHLSRIV